MGSAAPRPTRAPAVAGSFYPSSPAALTRALEASFDPPRGPGPRPRPNQRAPRRTLAVMVPHAGYVYSGPVAAHAFHRLALEEPPASVLLLGVNHHGLGKTFALSDEDWRTPLGTVPADLELVRRLVGGVVEIDASAHRREHSLEVEVPFLQATYPEAGLKIVPLQVTFTSLPRLEALGRQLARRLDPKEVLVIASSDLSHYQTPEVGRRQDDRALAPLLRGEPEALYRRVVSEDISMCGIAPVVAMLYLLRDWGIGPGRLLAQGSSGDAEPMDTVVGYASAAWERA